MRATAPLAKPVEEAAFSVELAEAELDVAVAEPERAGMVPLVEAVAAALELTSEVALAGVLELTSEVAAALELNSEIAAALG